MKFALTKKFCLNIHIYIYIYMCVCVCVCVCVYIYIYIYWQHFYINTYFVEHT